MIILKRQIRIINQNNKLIYKIRKLGVLLFLSIFCSCTTWLKPKNEFQNNHNVIGIWSLGSIQYKNEELLGWVYINTLDFMENDSIWFSDYPKSTFGNYGTFKCEFNGKLISLIEIVTDDTLYAGTYEVLWREYYTTPRARDSILSGLVLQSENTLLYLNSRMTGWRK